MNDATIPATLRQIGELIRTQNNRITDQPLFIVQQKREYVTNEDYNDSTVQWRHDGDSDHAEVTPQHAGKLEKAFRRTGEMPAKYERFAVMHVWEFVTACFTEQGCKDFLAVNGHNLEEARIYAEGSYRNEEFRSVRKFLQSLAPEEPKPLAHGNRGDWYLMANARRICSAEMKRSENWVLAKELFATGSVSARQICLDAGIDPEAKTVTHPI